MPQKQRKPKNADKSNRPAHTREEIFHFVNVDPNSETQKSENRSVIRSHASKYIWRQHRAGRAETAAAAAAARTMVVSSKVAPNNDSRETSRNSVVPEDPTALYSSSSYPEINWASAPLDPITHDATGYRVPDSRNEDPPLFDEDEPTRDEDYEERPTSLRSKYYYAPLPHAVGHVGGPFNQLISWFEDPTYPSMLGESAISKLMRYAAFELWPGLVPGADGQEWVGDAAAKAWLPRALGNEALYTAFLYGAAGHMQTRKRLAGAHSVPQTREEKMEQIICESETVKRLNKMMRDPAQSCTDEVILAVLCMAFNRTDYSAWSVKNNPSSKAPLRNLQWLDVYGGLSLNDQHVKGLLALIETRGGIEAMKLPGLAETLSVSAIMLSTKNLAKSRQPFFPIFKSTLTGDTPGWPVLDRSMEAEVLEGDPPDPIQSAGLPDVLTTLLNDMRDYTAVINIHCQGLLPKLSLATIADRRNYIQYRLTELDPIYDIPDTFAVSKAYEPCRLAAMVYSMMVVYPLPAANRPFRRLSGMLKTALQDAYIFWDSGADMLLWVLVMGGICSEQCYARNWFVDTLREMSAVTAVRSWGDLKRKVTSIMWMDTVCDSSGQALWDEVSNTITSVQ